MPGDDRGVVTLSNGKYRMNGSVGEAVGIFSNWAGRNVHTSGDIEFYPFGAPQFTSHDFSSGRVR